MSTCGCHHLPHRGWSQYVHDNLTTLFLPHYFIPAPLRHSCESRNLFVTFTIADFYSLQRDSCFRRNDREGVLMSESGKNAESNSIWV